MPNDARNKLRNMGGIMASYPELMHAATQRYQTGGNVRVPSITNTQSPLRYIPTVPPMAQPGFGPRSSGYAPGLLETGTVDPRLMGPARRAPLSPADAAMNAEIERGILALRDQGPLTSGGGARNYMATPDMPFDRRVPAGLEVGLPERRAGRVTRTVEAGEGSIGDEAGVTVDDLLEGSGASAFKLPDIKSVRPVGLDTDSGFAALRRQNELRAARGLPPLTPEQTQEFEEVAREAPSPLDVARLDKLSGELAEIEDRKVGGVFASSADRARAEELSAERDAIQQRVGETLAAEDTAMSMPLQPKRLTQDQIDKANELARKDPNFTFPAADEEGPVEDAATDTGTGTGGTGGTGGPAPAPSKKDLRSRYEEKIALFKEIYGEDDEERARDKAMSLAMMGLAIAAGQSPDALTNIARGAAVGLQGMSEQEQARRERERGLQTLALQTAISEEEALRDADIRASQSELEFQRDMSMEEYKARLNAMYGAGSRDARNIIDFTQNAYDSAYTAASEQTAPDYNSEVETPHQYAMRQAQQAAASMQKMFPGYGGQTVGTPASEGATVPTVTTQEEYDALPSGAQFMQNGQMRRKP